MQKICSGLSETLEGTPCHFREQNDSLRSYVAGTVFSEFEPFSGVGCTSLVLLNLVRKKPDSCFPAPRLAALGSGALISADHVLTCPALVFGCADRCGFLLAASEMGCSSAGTAKSRPDAENCSIFIRFDLDE